MKNLVFAIVFLLFCSCAPNYLTKEQSEPVYSHQIQMTKAELKQKILTYISEKFVSGKAVLQVNEDGLISGNTSVTIDHFLLNIDILEYSFIIKYEDNSYKVKCVVKDIRDPDVGSRPISMWGKYSEKIKSEFDTFDYNLNKYLTEKNSDF